MKQAIILFAMLIMATGLRAQTLTVYQKNGTATGISVNERYKQTIVGESLIISVDGENHAFTLADIDSITYQQTKGDVNRDGDVGIGDIVTITNIMTGVDSEESDNGHAPEGVVAVDLGLPSGTLWANMNVGATSVQDNGLYFAWGEIVGYTSDTSDGCLFDYANYKWMTEGQSNWKYVNKYQTADGTTDACWYQYNWDTLEYEFIGDGLTELQPEDDAAHVYWGGDWRMPTLEEIKELIDNTTYEWITVGTVSGGKFTSMINGKSIFLPAAGFRYGGEFYGVGSYGGCWSSTLYASGPSLACRLSFRSGFAGWSSYGRGSGHTVRPVR